MQLNEHLQQTGLGRVRLHFASRAHSMLINFLFALEIRVTNQLSSL